MRIMLAGTASGCGKTTAAMAVLGALRARGFSVQPFKSGPDYIDPGFHRMAAGRACHNLDAWLCSPGAIARLIRLGEADADIGVIEGAMGFYDGIGGGTDGSAWALARQTGTPVILVVDAAGSAASAAATALGFLNYRRDSGIAAAFVNRASSERHYGAVRDALAGVGLACVGWLPKDGALRLPERHLGLVPAEEADGARGAIGRAAAQVRLDVDALCRIAARAAAVDAPAFGYPRPFAGRRIGLARDRAFAFVYEANRIALEAMGAELVEFSPLSDAALPGGLDALYLPGGFPEVFEEALKANRTMVHSVRAAVGGGLRVYAECGGMLYLAMIGALPMTWRMTGRLQRFGYVTVTDSDGYRFPAHEFHHSAVEADLPARFVVDRRGTRYPDGYVYRNTLAGYAHLHFFERPELAERIFGG